VPAHHVDRGGRANVGVEPASCRAEAGAVMHTAPSGPHVRRGGAAGGSASRPRRRAAQGSERLAPRGKPTKRLDTRFKVNGTAQFGIDVRVPGC